MNGSFCIWILLHIFINHIPQTKQIKKDEELELEREKNKVRRKNNLFSLFMFYQWSFSLPLYLNGNVRPTKQAQRISPRREGDFKKSAAVFSGSRSLSGSFLLSSEEPIEGRE